jgi:flavin-dependent dehydrogenase
LKVSFLFEGVDTVNYDDDFFYIETDSGKKFTSKTAIGAFGKRSNIDKHLQRKFIEKKSSWLGIKAHYQLPDFPEHLVALHNFKGGYGGLSKTENGAVNFCYLTNYKSFKSEKDMQHFNKKVVSENPFLADFLKEAIPIFDQPLSIAQISFQQKEAVENHMLMCGDSAGLIHPLCGNGMAMAIHSAKIASELLSTYLTAKDPNRYQLEVAYKKQWSKAFKHRLWIGRKLQWLLLHHTLSNIAMKIVAKSPKLLQLLIKQTHGKPIKC